MTRKDKEFMQQAIDLSIENVKNGGGPFGAVIVENGKIIATGVNRVTASNDPTAHAEVNAIRAACQQKANFKLTGCSIYTSCEPCPMCLAAIYWAGISHIYYGNTKQDAEEIYDEIERPLSKRSIPTRMIMREQALQAFRDWAAKPDKTEY